MFTSISDMMFALVLSLSLINKTWLFQRTSFDEASGGATIPWSTKLHMKNAENEI